MVNTKVIYNCILCLNPVECDIYVQCIYCNRISHYNCEVEQREKQNRKYCLCSSCNKVGTLAVTTNKSNLCTE